MIVYSTVLEVNGNQVIYQVYKNGPLAFFNPSRPNYMAPILFVKEDDNDWRIQGTNDDKLRRQVLLEIGAA